MKEFSALAARVAASVGDLRGVLILSRDGLVLGAFPDGDEALLKPAWLRFAALGDADRGFVEFGDELWAYIRRGRYASFAVSGPKIRPGLLMDQLEQTLIGAEDLQAKREAFRLPDAAPDPEPRLAVPSDVAPDLPFAAPPEPIDGADDRAAAAPTVSGPPSAPAPAPGPDGGPERPDLEASPSDADPERTDERRPVDPVLLAQEFSRLLQETGERDET